jgi:hypothetical protein
MYLQESSSHLSGFSIMLSQRNLQKTGRVAEESAVLAEKRQVIRCRGDDISNGEQATVRKPGALSAAIGLFVMFVSFLACPPNAGGDRAAAEKL